eukprot:1192015-Prorocentrum_minimum.AAC.2
MMWKACARGGGAALSVSFGAFYVCACGPVATNNTGTRESAGPLGRLAIRDRRRVTWWGRLGGHTTMLREDWHDVA